MLLNVRHDREFQAFLDRQENRLYHAIRPPIAAAIRIQMNRGSLAAQGYLIKRGERVFAGPL